MTATISECTVSECSYNHDGCHAQATVGTAPGCITFIEIGTRGGLDTVTAAVGACQRADCRFNVALECAAPAVRVGPGGGPANCLTYDARA